MLRHLIRHRLYYFIGTFLVLMTLSSQLLHMVFNGNVNVMFDEENTHFQRLKQLDQQYIESNYLIILFEPAEGSVYQRKSLKIVEELTEALWQLPFAVRVDSVSNHPRLEVSGDNLSVTNLVQNSLQLTDQQRQSIQRYARDDQQIQGRLVSPGENATALFATIALPEQHLEAVLQVSKQALLLKQDFEQRYPGSHLYLNGDIAIENAMLHVTMDDILRVNPIVFLTIFTLLGLFLRSVVAIAASAAVVVAATGISSGIHVLLGFEMNPITMMAPAIIMVLAVADSIHVLTVFRIYRMQGQTPEQAMLQSLQKNLSPIFWTSMTTAVGFMGMNFGDSPPFRTMGNMAAIGVLFAFIATFTVLPFVTLLFPSSNNHRFTLTSSMRRLSQWVITSSRTLLIFILSVSVVLALCIPSMKLNDDISEYFDASLPIHDSIEFAKNNTNGVQYILYSMDSGTENGINDPEFLNSVDAFSYWLRQQTNVTGVSSYVDVLKKIHKTMNNDSDAFYAIPNSSELSAQYLLLYEMSLPPGMDLTRDITLDRSALKLTVNVRDSDNQTLMELEQRIDQWLASNHPQLRSQGSSQLLLFAHMGNNIIRSMVDGSLFTLVFITIFMIIALKSWKFGILSIIPNVLPPIIVYGLWAIFVGHVNHAAAMTFSICLGLVVDDSIHFISKYLSSRRENYSPEQALEHSFVTSGTAIVITSITLICGVLLLSLSNFTVNDTMSLMLSGIILTALLFDLFFLPVLLLLSEKAPFKLPKRTLLKSSANTRL
jgi:predicted RND superfamily exporter protein